MSAALHTLQVLLEQAEAERDQAQRALVEVLQRARAARGQADSLLQYRGEYDQRWSGQFKSGGTMEIMRCYQDFSGRLGEAIESQGQRAAQAEQRVAGARERVAALEMRVASIAKLMARRRAEIERIAARQDQKLSDELAARLARQRAPQGMLP
ncbi:MAG: flagellar export protein FliJ [Pelomonas sp.]|nr:flagellar export protein FliJ [Roseateles sp.]